MATKRPGGGLKGQFSNRGQYKDPEGRRVKVDTTTGEVLRSRDDPRQYKRVTPIKAPRPG